MTNDANGGWSAHAKMVIDRLEKLEEGQKSIAADVVEIKVAIGRLKLVSGIMGAGAGAVIGVVIKALSVAGG